jgi:hypothetical protein
MDRLYVETSIVSHATARPNRDIATAGLQQQARDWWNRKRHQFELVTSQLTLDEAGDGDPTASTKRLKLLADLPLIDIDADVVALANRLIDAHTMPEKAAADAIHVAAAAFVRAKYLLTLNCRHIANAHELPRIYEILGQEGLGSLLICTPAEFLGGQDQVDEELNP